MLVESDMCGIAGFIQPGLSSDEMGVRIRRMCDAIVHRGPDSSGLFVSGGAALGMRRLSVIDVAGGDQPIFNEDRSLVVVFNGEVYNHRRLRAELIRLGYRFRTNTDTEVLVHAYQEYGEAMLAKLRGMFAFAIWDVRRQELFVARDHSGMKPLSYMEVPGGLVFFSELRSLLAYAGTNPEIDDASVLKYLSFGYVPGASSVFRRVRKLEPAHCLKWSLNRGVQVSRYWSLPEVRRNGRDESTLEEELRERLRSAVGSHLESDVPLGAFLSGGLDSSTVVSLMNEKAPGRVKTFSIGFSESEYDESHVAKRVAGELECDHSEMVLNPDIALAIDSIADVFDEPFGDSSAIPTFFVSQLARESVTVALSGDGGDELFGGYSRYRSSLAHGFRPGFLGQLAAASALMLPHIVPGRNKLIDIGRSRRGRYAAQISLPTRLDEGGVAKEGIKGADQRMSDFIQESLLPDSSDDFAADMMRFDFGTYLPGDILTKVDRSSMAVSLEARVPFLDVDLIEFAFGLPGRLRVDKDGSKKLFRRAIHGIIPDFLFDLPKRGFSVPLAEWFRGPLVQRAQAVSSGSGRIADYVEISAVARIVKEHCSGRRDHSVMIWRLIVLERWLQNVKSGSLARPPSLRSVISG